MSEAWLDIKDWWQEGDDIILQVRATDELIRCVKSYVVSTTYLELDCSDIEEEMIFPIYKYRDPKDHINLYNPED